jgi:hypothetical protein
LRCSGSRSGPPLGRAYAGDHGATSAVNGSSSEPRPGEALQRAIERRLHRDVRGGDAGAGSCWRLVEAVVRLWLARTGWRSLGTRRLALLRCDGRLARRRAAVGVVQLGGSGSLAVRSRLRADLSWAARSTARRAESERDRQPARIPEVRGRGGNRFWERRVTSIAVRFVTPGLNFSRYERPLAERRLLGGAVRDRWESGDWLPPRRLAHEIRLCGAA